MNGEEYLSEVYRIIRENFRSSDPSGGMAVASAAYLVKHVLGHDQTVFGFEKFKDVLQVLEKRELLQTGSDSKSAFAVWLTEKAAASAQPIAQSIARFRPLRNQVWFAFVSATPAGGRFLNRKTGEVRIGVTDHPADDDWVEITPIDSSAEREIALRFLKERGIEDQDIITCVSSERWYVEFPKALARNNPTLARDWKRERSQQVIEKVNAWCERHDVNKRLVFDEVPTSPSKGAVRNFESPEKQLRQLLLAVVHRMPTDELLRLHLPAYQVVAVLRPELLG